MPDLTKLDIAERHIITAITLMAIEADPVSTHLQVMAADEILLAVADYRGVQLRNDMRAYIVEGRLKEVQYHKRKAYNAFKHADRDPEALFSRAGVERLGEVNELGTIFNISALHELSGRYPEVFGPFMAVMILRHSSIFKLDEMFADKPEFRRLYDAIQEDDIRLAWAGLRYQLRLQGILPRD